MINGNFVWFINIYVILVLIRFAKAKLFRTSYTVQKTKNIFANLFSVGINKFFNTKNKFYCRGKIIFLCISIKIN